jgi:hypothetical protein
MTIELDESNKGAPSSLVEALADLFRASRSQIAPA